jgi:hypothetical protein
MPVRWLKAIPETGRRMFVLVNAWLRTVCDATVVDTNPAPGWVTQSGTDGAVLDAAPSTFVAAGASFTGGDVGRYLSVYNATRDMNNGLRKIVAVINGTTVVLTSGVYGQPFTTEINLTWQVIDPTVLDAAGSPSVGVVAGAGTSPAWQLALTLPASPSNIIQVQVQPLGNWNTGTHAPTLGLTSTNHEADTTPLWYWRWDGFTLIGWTVTNGGGSAYRILYAGYAQSFHPDNDPSCVVQTNAAPASLATTGSQLLSDNATVGVARFLVPTVAGSPVFTGLTIDGLDLRVGDWVIPFGNSVAPNRDLRGVLSNLLYVSSLKTYGSFVNNTRTLVCLGNGLAVTWDGSLVV